MSISVIQQPGTVEQSGSYLLFSAVSPDIYVDPGAYYAEYITFNGVPSNFSVIGLTWYDGTKSVNVTFNDALLAGSYIVLAPSTAPYSLDEWVGGNLVDALNSIQSLREDFLIQKNGTNRIKITSRKPGTLFNITFSDNTGNTTYSSKTNGRDVEYKENFTIATTAEFSIFPLSNYTSIPYLPFAVNGKVEVDLSEILPDYHTIAWPSSTSVQVVDVSGMVLKYHLWYGEAYGAPLQIQQMTKSATKYLLPGGRSKDDFRKNGSFGTWWLGTSPNWLTYRPTRRVGINEPFYLYYMPVADEQIHFKVTLIFKDGTTKKSTLATKTVKAYSLWHIKAGFDDIKALVPDGQHLVSWSVYVQNNAQQTISQIATAELDQDKNVDEIHIMYQNGLGMPDVMRFTGELGHFTEFTKTMANLYLATPKYDIDRAKVHTSSSFQNGVEVNTKYLETQEADQLIDFLNSKEYFMIIDGERIPVTISSDTFNRYTSNSGRRNGHTFTIKPDSEKYA